VHGSSTAGGAYLTGLSDYVIMVRGRAGPSWPARRCSRPPPARSPPKKNWAAPRCTPAISGLGDYLAEDDATACASRARSWRSLDWNRESVAGAAPLRPPRYDAEELLPA
jgi:geranyl-CoA carboxylase beta subunit